MRYFFEISYHGKNYAGWQSQSNALGIQSVLENALSKILRMPVRIVGSGRTDAGVHCIQQFFHADIEKSFNRFDLNARLNSFLPSDIAISRIVPVKPDAHARYSAIERTYYYKITTEKSPLLQGLAFYVFKSLDIQTMNKAASLLVGVHDFTSFSKVKTDVNHFICKVKSAEWKVKGQNMMFTIKANRFLRGMVRALVGTLLDVGTGKTSIQEFRNIVHNRDRRGAGSNVPPYGLYLAQVKYPRNIFLETT
jgi:tRNA pseudouridine38-40 synthase